MVKEINQLRFYLQSNKPHTDYAEIGDPKENILFQLKIRALQMGIDNSSDILVDLKDYLNLMAEGSEQRVKEDKIKFKML